MHGWILQERLRYWQRIGLAALVVAMMNPSPGVQYPAALISLAALAALYLAIRSRSASEKRTE